MGKTIAASIIALTMGLAASAQPLSWTTRGMRRNRQASQ